MPKVPPQELRQMSDFERGWVVGILEGEACFSFNRRSENCTTARVQLQMGDVEVVKTLVRVTGLGSIGGPYKTRSKDHTPMWGWNLSSYASVQLMKLVRNDLSSRRQKRIDEVLAEVC
jgi:hypothetical protein